MSDAAPVPFEPRPPAELRVGDTERYQAATALGEHFATGRLDQDEYDTRVRDAYAGRTRADLQRLFADLPEPVPFRPTPPTPPPGWASGRGARDRPRRAPRLPPAVPVLLILVLFVALSAAVHFPVFPLLLFGWFFWGRRAWR